MHKPINHLFRLRLAFWEQPMIYHWLITSSSFLFSDSLVSWIGADTLAKVPLCFSQKQTKVWLVSAKIKRAGETNHRIGWSGIWINFVSVDKNLEDKIFLRLSFSLTQIGGNWNSCIQQVMCKAQNQCNLRWATKQSHGHGVDHDDGTFFGTMECQWFFTCQPLVSMVFPMVFP